MGKVFGILLMVAAIWVGLTVFSEGDAAFGGLFASAKPDAGDGGGPLPARVKDRVGEALQAQEDRTEKGVQE